MRDEGEFIRIDEETESSKSRETVNEEEHSVANNDDEYSEGIQQRKELRSREVAQSLCQGLTYSNKTPSRHIMLLSRGFMWKKERKIASAAAKRLWPQLTSGEPYPIRSSLDVLGEEVDIGVSLHLMMVKHLSITLCMLAVPAFALFIYFCLASTTSSIPFPNIVGSFGHVLPYQNVSNLDLAEDLSFIQFDSFVPVFSVGLFNGTYDRQETVDYPLELGMTVFACTLLFCICLVVWVARFRRTTMVVESRAITSADYSVLVRGISRIEQGNPSQIVSLLRKEFNTHFGETMNIICAKKDRHLILSVQKANAMRKTLRHQALSLNVELLRRIDYRKRESVLHKRRKVLGITVDRLKALERKIQGYRSRCNHFC